MVFVLKKLTIQEFLEIHGFKEEIPDSDGKFGGCIIPKDQYDFLWKVSWLASISTIVAILNCNYKMVIVPLSACITSLNYWRKPYDNWRRYLDITTVQLGLWYNIYSSFGAENAVPYWIFSLIGMSCYPISIYAKEVIKSSWLSTIIHSLVHLFGNISYIFLYAGFIP